MMCAADENFSEMNKTQGFCEEVGKDGFLSRRNTYKTGKVGTDCPFESDFLGLELSAFCSRESPRSAKVLPRPTGSRCRTGEGVGS